MHFSTFGEISYFDDEFRGDLIILPGAIYYFPVRRSGYNRIYLFDGPIDRVLNFLLKLGLVLFSGVGLIDIVDAASDTFRLARRPNKTSMPQSIMKLGLWKSGEDPKVFQNKLDWYIQQRSQMKSNFSNRSIPKPFSIKKSEIKNISLKWRLIVQTEYESHDFGISPFRRKALEAALHRAQLLA